MASSSRRAQRRPEYLIIATLTALSMAMTKLSPEQESHCIRVDCVVVALPYRSPTYIDTKHIQEPNVKQPNG